MRKVFIHTMVLESVGRGKERRVRGTGRLLAAFASILFAGAAFAESSLVLTGNRLGRLGPCGCAVNPQGGLDRMVEWASRKKNDGALWLDSGNNLFPFSQLNADLAPSWKRTAMLIAGAYKELGIKAILPAAKDFAGGIEFLKDWYQQSGAVAVAANLSYSDSQRVFWKKSWRTGEWGITGVVLSETPDESDGFKVTDPDQALKSAIADLRAQGARYIVVLSGLDLQSNRRIAQSFQPDLIAGSSDDILDAPLQVGRTWIWQQRRESQSLAVVDAGKQPVEVGMTPEWNPASKKGREWRQKISLVDKANQEGNRSVAVAEKSTTKNPTKPSGFVANQFVCKQCHEAQYQFWEKTHHASAYLSLYSKNQHFDPECIGCHSLGYLEPGGFKSIADPLILKAARARRSGEKPVLETVLEETFAGESPVKPLDSRQDPDRYASLKSRFHETIASRAAHPGWEKIYIGVQCEHCHGNRNQHVYGKRAGAKRQPVSSKTCLKCHTSERDPGFSFAAKISRVACPRL